MGLGERKWLTPPSAEEEAPALLAVFGVLRRVWGVLGVLRRVLVLYDAVSAWLMWVKEKFFRGRRSRVASAEIEDIAGGAREERELCWRRVGFTGGSGGSIGGAQDSRAPKLGADRLCRIEGCSGDDVLSW